MATQTTNIPGSGYGNVYLDSLIWGAAWTDIATPIRYWFGEGSTVAPSDLSGVAFDGETWDAPEKDAFIAVTHQYEAVCNLKFVEAGECCGRRHRLVEGSGVGHGRFKRHTHSRHASGAGCS